MGKLDANDVACDKKWCKVFLETIKFVAKCRCNERDDWPSALPRSLARIRRRHARVVKGLRQPQAVRGQ